MENGEYEKCLFREYSSNPSQLSPNCLNKKENHPQKPDRVFSRLSAVGPIASATANHVSQNNQPEGRRNRSFVYIQEFAPD